MERNAFSSELENHAVKVVSAYIDLNPVRAGIVEDPKGYRWCGYAVAVAAEEEVRCGAAKAMGKERREMRMGEEVSL